MGRERVGWPLKIGLPASRLHITKKGRRRRQSWMLFNKTTYTSVSRVLSYGLNSVRKMLLHCVHSHVGIFTCDQGKKHFVTCSRHFVAVVQWYFVQQAEIKEQALMIVQERIANWFKEMLYFLFKFIKYSFHSQYLIQSFKSIHCSKYGLIYARFHLFIEIDW